MTGLRARLSGYSCAFWLAASASIAILSVFALLILARPNSSALNNLDAAALSGQRQELAKAAAKVLPVKARFAMTSRELPLAFEPNVGQTDSHVRFLSHGNRYALFLTDTEAVFTLRSGMEDHSRLGKGTRNRPILTSHANSRMEVLRMKLAGANSKPQVAGLEPLPGHANYFHGKDRSQWRLNVPTYARVNFSEVYPGVDLIYYGNHRELEYDFVVRPGPDPAAISLVFSKSHKNGSLTIDHAGNLIIPTAGGEIRFHKPVLYQQIDETVLRRQVEGRFKILAENLVGFEVGAYDHSIPLVIDPTLVYATYLGGNGFDGALAVAADSSGNAYVTGLTTATDFPTTGSDPAPGGGEDAFVTKLNADGTQMVYSTYLGGTNTDEAFGIALDTSNNAYITGDTYSTDFPGATGGDSTNGDAFVSKLDSTGSVVFSKLLGGNAIDFGQGIKADSNGNSYVVGATTSTNFPIVNGFQTNCASCTTNSTYDSFVAKLNSTGMIVYSSFLGGDSSDRARGVAINSGGKMFVIGTTDSTDFPTTAGAPAPTDPDSGTASDAFLAEFDPAGSGPTSLLFSTYLGDASQDIGNGIALDASGNVYVVGETDFTDTPSGVPGFQTTNAGGTDAFIAKFNLSTKSYVFATFLGGSSDEDGAGIAVDGAGNVFVAGDTISSDFPTANAVDNTFNSSGAPDAFVAKISPDGTSLLFSTLLGGEDDDESQGIALGGNGNVVVVGTTSSSDFPATTGAVQTACADSSSCSDGFVASYSGLSSGSTVSVSPGSLSFGGRILNSSTTKTVTISNGTASSVSLTSRTITGTNSGDFTVDASSTCSTSTAIGASNSCTIVVAFKPGAEGSRSASLDIVLSTGSTSVALSGTGVRLTMKAGPEAALSATVTAGGSATYRLAMTAPGFVGDITLSCTGAPAGSTCTVTPGVVHMDGTHGATFTVTVTTTARSMMLPPPSADWRMPRLIPIQLLGMMALLACVSIAARRKRTRWVLATTMLCVLMWGACGGGSSPKPSGGTPAGTYNLTISGTADGATQTLGLTLNVN